MVNSAAKPTTMFSVQTVVVVQGDGRQCQTKPLGIPEVHSRVGPPSDGPEFPALPLLRFPHRITFIFIEMPSTTRRLPKSSQTLLCVWHWNYRGGLVFSSESKACSSKRTTVTLTSLDRTSGNLSRVPEGTTVTLKFRWIVSPNIGPCFSKETTVTPKFGRENIY